MAAPVPVAFSDTRGLSQTLAEVYEVPPILDEDTFALL